MKNEQEPDYNEPCGRPGCGLVAGKHVWADGFTQRVGPKCRDFIPTGEYRDPLDPPSGQRG